LHLLIRQCLFHNFGYHISVHDADILFEYGYGGTNIVKATMRARTF